MRESLMYGSVRGARGNSRPYRDAALLRLLTAANGTWRLSLRCTKLRRDRRYADIDRPPAPIASEAYDPSPTLAVHCTMILNACLEPYQSTRLSLYNAGR